MPDLSIHPRLLQRRQGRLIGLQYEYDAYRSEFISGLEQTIESLNAIQNGLQLDMIDSCVALAETLLRQIKDVPPYEPLPSYFQIGLEEIEKAWNAIAEYLEAEAKRVAI